MCQDLYIFDMVIHPPGFRAKTTLRMRQLPLFWGGNASSEARYSFANMSFSGLGPLGIMFQQVGGASFFWPFTLSFKGVNPIKNSSNQGINWSPRTYTLTYFHGHDLHGHDAWEKLQQDIFPHGGEFNGDESHGVESNP